MLHALHVNATVKQKQVIFFDRCLIRVVSKQQQVNICAGQTGTTVFFAVMFACLHLHWKERYRSSPRCQEDVHMNKHGYVSVDELIALREKEHGKTTSLWWHGTWRYCRPVCHGKIMRWKKVIPENIPKCFFSCMIVSIMQQYRYNNIIWYNIDSIIYNYPYALPQADSPYY